MTIKFYAQDKQMKTTFYKTLADARAQVKILNTGNPYGSEFESVRALDLYSGKFLGYAVEHK